MDPLYEPLKTITPEGATIITMRTPTGGADDRGLIGGVFELNVGAIVGSQMFQGGEGLAHYMEHIACGCSSRSFGLLGIKKFMNDSLGVFYNAATNYYTTTYMQNESTETGIVIVQEDFWKAFNAIADGVFFPNFLESDLAVENTRVSNEIPDANTARRVEERVINANLFNVKELALSPTGSREQLATYSKDVVQEFHSKAYVQSNLTVSLVGSVDHAEAVDKIRLYLRDVPAGIPAPKIKDGSVVTGEARQALEERNDGSVSAALYFARPNFSSYDEQVAYGRAMDSAADLIKDKIRDDFGIYHIGFGRRGGKNPYFHMRVSTDNIPLVNKAMAASVDYLYSDELRAKLPTKLASDFKKYETSIRTGQPTVQAEAIRLLGLNDLGLPLLSDKDWLAKCASRQTDEMMQQFDRQKQTPAFLWVTGDKKVIQDITPIDQFDAQRGYTPTRPAAIRGTELTAKIEVK